MWARTPIDIGLAVREQRKNLGLDQRGLAAKLGVNRQWVIDLEKGRPGAALGTVLRALNVVGLFVSIEKSEPASPQAKRASPLPAIDIDAVIDRARGRKP